MSESAFVPSSETARVERAHGAPEPPELARRVRLTRLQWIGIPLLAAVPILAMAGVLDPSTVTVERRIGALAVRAELPERHRENRVAVIEIDLANEGRDPIAVDVAISPEYLEEAVEVELVPSAERAWATHLDAIAPGDRARVSLTYQPERAGLREGILRIRSSDGGEVRIPLRTFVFP